jgi:hypothetical protein
VASAIKEKNVLVCFKNMASGTVDTEGAAPDIVAMGLERQIEEAEKSCGTIRHQQSLAVARVAALHELGEEVDNQCDAIQRLTKAKDRAVRAKRAERQAEQTQETRCHQPEGRAADDATTQSSVAGVAEAPLKHRDTSPAPSSDTADASKSPSKFASGSSTTLPSPFSPSEGVISSVCVDSSVAIPSHLVLNIEVPYSRSHPLAFLNSLLSQVFDAQWAKHREVACQPSCGQRRSFWRRSQRVLPLWPGLAKKVCLHCSHPHHSSSLSPSMH